MKLLMPILLAAAMAAGLAAGLTATARDYNDWPDIRRYQDSNAQVRNLPAQQRRVVFIGNSITYNWARMRPDFFRDNGYIGRGISGQTTYQILCRFRQDVVSLRPTIVVINCGVNDIAENTHLYDEDITVGNIDSMVEIALANGITPVLTTTLPAAAFPWRPEITDSSDKIVALNARLARLAADRSLILVDYYSSMLAPDSPDRALNPAYTDDGVHPTPDGYAVMESIINPILLPLLDY